MPTSAGKRKPAPGQQYLSRLTPRELEIIDLVSNVFKTSQIAHYLFVSENTVKFHRKNILVKLNAVSMIEALSVLRVGVHHDAPLHATRKNYPFG